MSLIFKNATVVTMDAQRRVLTDAILAVEGDRIEFIGREEGLPERFRSDRVIDGKGKVIFPGFVNIHTHAALSILRGIGDDLGIAPAYSPNVPQGVFLSPYDCHVFALLGGLEALRFGTTCIVDNYIHEHEAAKAFDLLGMRAIVSERLHDADLFKIPNGVYEFDLKRGEELLDRNIELYERWNMAANGRIRCYFGPHAPDTCSTRYLQRIYDTACSKRTSLVIHLAQSRRELAEINQRSGKSPVAYLTETNLLGPNLIAGHCIFVSPEDIHLLKQSGTQVCHLSTSNAKGGMMAPVKDMLEMGTNICLGTDNMAGDMIEAMRSAVTIARMKNGDHLALRAMDALEMATIHGARALGMEKDIGSLEVGKKADLVMVDFNQAHLAPLFDPVANLVFNGQGRDVDLVMVDGQILVQDGHVKGVNEQDVVEEAQKLAAALWKKMPGSLLRERRICD